MPQYGQAPGLFAGITAFLPMAPDGKLGSGPALALDKWHVLEFAWILGQKGCQVSVDGQVVLVLDQQNLTGNGLSYLHLRSETATIDESGFLIESVSVDIEDPVAPPLTGEQQRVFLDLYLPSYYNPPPERRRGALDQEEIGNPGHSPIG